MSAAGLAALKIAGASELWGSLGFRVDDHGRIALRNGALEFSDQGSGMLGLVVAGIELVPSDLEGVPLISGAAFPAVEHDNGAIDLDHIVLMTDSLERTSAAVEVALGLPLKRIRETGTVRQGFHRFTDEAGGRGCIIEIVEHARATHTALFGLVVNVGDLGALCERLGSDVISAPKPAVQPGRSIATVRSQFGLGVPVALMTPEP